MSESIATVSFRTDAELKNAFAQTVEQMGLTVTTAFNAFMRATVRQQAMPFRLRAGALPSADEQEALALLASGGGETFRSARELAEADGWYR